MQDTVHYVVKIILSVILENNITNVKSKKYMPLEKFYEYSTLFAISLA